MNLGTKILEFGPFWAELWPFLKKNEVITKQINDFAYIFLI